MKKVFFLNLLLIFSIFSLIEASSCSESSDRRRIEQLFGRETPSGLIFDQIYDAFDSENIKAIMTLLQEHYELVAEVLQRHAPSESINGRSNLALVAAGLNVPVVLDYIFISHTWHPSINTQCLAISSVAKGAFKTLKYCLEINDTTIDLSKLLIEAKKIDDRSFCASSCRDDIVVYLESVIKKYK